MPSEAPRHDIPNSINNESDWNLLPEEEQLRLLYQQAEDTVPKMIEFGTTLQEDIHVKFIKGPLKGKDRVLQKCHQDYDGDLRRVIDLVRCSFVFVFDTFVKAKGIIDEIVEDTADPEWTLVRLKNGFEKPENFLVGGYRDIKLNIRNQTTGHIMEVQLHHTEYYDLKNDSGHLHYEFARQQRISGIIPVLRKLSIIIC